MNQELHVFVTVVEKANFSHAAHALHVTQPAVSRYIKNLESSMNAKLLERSNKMVQMTKAGEIVYHYAKEILNLYGKMNVLVTDLMSEPSGMLNIGASYTYGEYILPHIIASIRNDFPKITPSIVIGNTREIVQQVRARDIDVGIIEGMITDEHVVMERFLMDSLVVVVSAEHELAGKESVSFSDLDEEVWIVREQGSGTREVTEQMFADHKLIPETIMEFGSTQIIKESVEAGLGISFLSTSAIRKELELERLKVLNIPGFPIQRPFTLVTQDTEFRTKAMEVFFKAIKAT